MNNKPILIKLMKLIGLWKAGVLRFDCGKHTIFFRDAIVNEGIEDLVVGLTDHICSTCHGEGETPGSWVYYPCGRCKGEGFNTPELDVERLHDGMQRLVEWSKAYPLDVFPEPDLKDARVGLASVGITLDQVSASSMRHVVTRVGEIAQSALEVQK